MPPDIFAKNLTIFLILLAIAISTMIDELHGITKEHDSFIFIAGTTIAAFTAELNHIRWVRKLLQNLKKAIEVSETEKT